MVYCCCWRRICGCFWLILCRSFLMLFVRRRREAFLTFCVALYIVVVWLFAVRCVVVVVVIVGQLD